MKYFGHLEFMRDININELAKLKEIMDRSGGYISIRLFLAFAINRTVFPTLQDLFHYVQGAATLFYQMCLESP